MRKPKWSSIRYRVGPPGVQRARRRRALLRVGLALAVAGLVSAAFSPSIQAAAKAGAVLADALGLPVPRPLARAVTPRDVTVARVAGVMFSAAPGDPAIVLVLGAAERGTDDPRAHRLAKALARAGRTVFVPDLELFDKRLALRDVRRIVAATRALEARTGAPVTLFGISYGGSFALLAGAHGELEGKVEQIATFGAYWDLLGVVQAASTGASLVGGRSIPWHSDPRARWALHRHALVLVAPRRRPGLRAALAGRREPQALPAGARAVYRLVTNRDPARTEPLALRLAPRARRLLDRFSPARTADRIDAPVISLHSTDDPLVPYAEALRMKRALPSSRVVTVDGFEHVDFQWRSALRALPDLFATWRFASWLLAPQE